MLKRAKFSVLLPTKDRLDLLKDAVETVRKQNFDDWQIVISDNASKADIKSYVESLNDHRIKYLRSDVPLAVTDNWNKALDGADGEWIVMLGDDDGLIPKYFERMSSYIEQLKSPDAIYHSAYHLLFPNVIASCPEGALSDITDAHDIFDGRSAPCILEPFEAHRIAREALDMKLSFSFNMQYFLLKKEFLDFVRSEFGNGEVFKGPYPDFYFANLCFLRAKRLGLIPFPMTVIGISPKSYGNFHFNKDEKTGVDFLSNNSYAQQAPADIKRALLPGSEMNSQWLVSVAKVRDALPEEKLKVGVRRYRTLQMINCIFSNKDEGASQIFSLLSFSEKIKFILLKIFILITWPVPRLLRIDHFEFMGYFTEQYLNRKKAISKVLLRIVGLFFRGRIVLPWRARALYSGINSVVDAYSKINQWNGYERG